MTNYEKVSKELDAVNEQIMFFSLPDTPRFSRLMAQRHGLEEKLLDMSLEEAQAEAVE